MLPRVFVAAALSICAASAAPAQDLNSFRAAHRRPPLTASAMLSAMAYQQAQAMAGRQRIDHAGFRQRVSFTGTTAAENVLVMSCARPGVTPAAASAGRACGCDDEACAIRTWSRSGRHRANMLRGDVSAYGIASASDGRGRRYWALELGGQ